MIDAHRSSVPRPAAAVLLTVWLGACGGTEGAPESAAAEPAPLEHAAPGPMVALSMQARGLAHGDEARCVFVAERRRADGSFERAADAVVRTVPGGVDVEVVGAPGAWRIGAVWTSIHAEYSAARPVDAGEPARLDLAPGSVTTAVGTPVRVRGIVRRGDAPVPGARVELDGGLAGVPTVTTMTDAGGRFAVGPCSVPEVRIHVSQGGDAAEVRGASGELFEIGL